MTRLVATLATLTLPAGWLLVTAALAWRYGWWIAPLGVGLGLMVHGCAAWISAATHAYLSGRAVAVEGSTSPPGSRPTA